MDETQTLRWVGGTQVGLQADTSELALHRLTFTVLAGPDQGLACAVEAPRVRIGTAESNDVRLHDDTVSRHHCEVVVRDGRARLHDLDSTNGTRIEGVPIVEALLEPGARVRLGQTVLAFASEVRWVPVDPTSTAQFGELVGVSEAMRSVFGLLERVGPTPLTVLLLGETGTGKDLAAHALHAASPRAKGPFEVVDCAALAGNLVEAELFGHERGAFTGADRSREGAFERAHQGTLFLDEIGELPTALQPKLLRALEHGEVRRLGGAEPIDVDVRVIAATHRDLPEAVAKGEFRQDLFFRIAEVIARLPPLRERPEDIPAICARLLELGARSSRVRRVTREALDALAAHPWPGNVRQLRNTLRRAAALATGDTIDLGSLRSLEQESLRTRAAPSAPLGASGAGTVAIGDDRPLRDARDGWLATLEKQYLERVLARFGDDVDAAAAHVGVHRKSLFRLLRQHGLRGDE